MAAITMIRAGTFAALLACAACATDEAAQNLTPEAAAGRGVVADLCSACHAIGLSGQSPNEKAPPLRTVLARYDRATLAESLQRGVLMSHPDLPHVFLSEPAARDVVAYLETLQARAAE